MTGPKLDDPDTRDIVDNKMDKAKLYRWISKKYPRVEPNPSIEESCIYTVFIKTFSFFFSVLEHKYSYVCCYILIFLFL